MTAIRLLDRVEQTVQEVLDSRMAPDDEIEWGVNLVPTVTDEQDMEMALGFYLALACPENGTRSVAHIIVQMERAHPDNLPKLVNDVWDRLVLSRMSGQLEEPSDTP